MKKNLFLLYYFILAINLNLIAGEINLKGNYYGKNLYVQNDFGENEYCVSEILVNGQKTNDNVNSTSFEIDFTLLKLNFGDTLNIVIKHKDGCTPKIINPEAIKSIEVFTVKKFNIDKNGKVTWETIGETPNTVYIVEQYRWKRWVEVAKVKSRANKASNYVYYTEIHPHFGVNNIRIREFDNNKEIEGKAETKFKSTSKLIQLLTQKAENELKFSGSTLYEIMDMNLNLILSGYDNKVDVSSLPKGKYYANFDNVSEVFTKK